MQISHYDISHKDPALGGMQRGDPRSELVLATFNSRDHFQILLQGFDPPPPGSPTMKHNIATDISPLAQVRKGVYRTPTLVLHGRKDTVVPVEQSCRFVNALR